MNSNYLTPNYDYQQRTYRIVGVQTDRIPAHSESERVEQIATRALASLISKLGSPYDREVDGKQTTVTVTKDGCAVAYTVPADGKYRIIGRQATPHQCAYCDRTGSIKWGKKFACSEHAEHEGLAWDAVRRTRAAAQEALGSEYKVSVKLNLDPRTSYLHK
tara:strand:- start:195 stop:677 length:483 start_codon:yes stop_codon:yes gene_type:complete